jgi:acetyltransferase
MPPELVIRTLASRDAARVQAFVRALSPDSRRERYFSAIAELAPAQLERTVCPHGGDASFAAFAGERVVGIAECSRGEFALIVAEAWRGCGLGGSLMERLLEHAARHALPAVHGVVRKDNRAMLRLGRSLGFRVEETADPELVRMELELALASA